MKKLLLAFALIGFIATSSFASATIVKTNSETVLFEDCDGDKCTKKDCKHKSKECTASAKKDCKKGDKKACCAKKGTASKGKRRHITAHLSVKRWAGGAVIKRRFTWMIAACPRHI